MQLINTHDAKTHLSRLVDRVLNGEEIVIGRSGVPVAKLVAFREEGAKRSGGQWKGLVQESSFGSGPSIVVRKPRRA